VDGLEEPRERGAVIFHARIIQVGIWGLGFGIRGVLGFVVCWDSWCLGIRVVLGFVVFWDSRSLGIGGGPKMQRVGPRKYRRNSDRRIDLFENSRYTVRPASCSKQLYV
jgi:hypothetical protein